MTSLPNRLLFLGTAQGRGVCPVPILPCHDDLLETLTVTDNVLNAIPMKSHALAAVSSSLHGVQRVSGGTTNSFQRFVLFAVVKALHQIHSWEI